MGYCSSVKTLQVFTVYSQTGKTELKFRKGMILAFLCSYVNRKKAGTLFVNRCIFRDRQTDEIEQVSVNV